MRRKNRGHPPLSSDFCLSPDGQRQWISLRSSETLASQQEGGDRAVGSEGRIGINAIDYRLLGNLCRTIPIACCRRAIGLTVGFALGLLFRAARPGAAGPPHALSVREQLRPRLQTGRYRGVLRGRGAPRVRRAPRPLGRSSSLPRACSERGETGSGVPSRLTSGMVFWISLVIASRYLTSAGVTRVIAVPERPARPVRPMRWT